jgi:hypothetical protein
MPNTVKETFPKFPSLDGLTKALERLDELTKLRELLEICQEENTDCEGNPKDLRIELLLDCYLSRSEYCLDELRNLLEKWRSRVKTH